MAKKSTKRIEFTDQQLAQIEDYAGHGLSIRDISRIYKMDPTTLQNHVSKGFPVSEYILRGRAKALEMVTNVLFRKCLEGEMRAIEFYLKSVHKWRDNDPVVNDEIKNAWGLSYSTEKIHTIEAEKDDNSNSQQKAIERN